MLKKTAALCDQDRWSVGQKGREGVTCQACVYWGIINYMVVFPCMVVFHLGHASKPPPLPHCPRDWDQMDLQIA